MLDLRSIYPKHARERGSLFYLRGCIAGDKRTAGGE